MASKYHIMFMEWWRTRKFFYLVCKFNEHAKFKIFTSFGETRIFEVDNIVKQGTILGPNLCSVLTWVCCETEKLLIGPLVNVDDLESINRPEDNVMRSHDSASHFQHKKRL